MIKPFLLYTLLHLTLSLSGQNSAACGAQNLRLIKTPAGHGCELEILKTDSSYLFRKDGKLVLQYNTRLAKIPANADPVFAKSGFIHPLMTPAGRIVTRIQPPDHLHHYGIWNAWTKTRFMDEAVDFWNLGQKTGRVDYDRTLSVEIRDDYVGLRVIQLHRVVSDPAKHTTALVETLEIKIIPSLNDLNIVDYISTYNCPRDQGLLLEEYRYGGFVFRGPESWGPETVDLITSEGKNQSDSDGERARWCLVVEKGLHPAGILLLSHPQNFNHPEPLRTWAPETNGGIANIFINFSPTRNTSWFLEMNTPKVLRYRIITFDHKMDLQTAETLWKDFANH